MVSISTLLKLDFMDGCSQRFFFKSFFNQVVACGLVIGNDAVNVDGQKGVSG